MFDFFLTITLLKNEKCAVRVIAGLTTLLQEVLKSVTIYGTNFSPIHEHGNSEPLVKQIRNTMRYARDPLIAKPPEPEH